MANQELLDYVNLAKGSGLTAETIMVSLLSAGWPEEEVKLALTEVFHAPPPPTPTPALAKPSATPVAKAKETALPAFADLFQEAWAIFKKRPWSFLGISLLPVAIALAGSAVMAATFFTSIFANVGSFTADTIMQPGFFSWLTGAIVGMAILGIVAGVATTVAQAAMIYLAKDSADTDWRAALKLSFFKLGKIFWINALVGIIVGLGFFLLIIPGFYLLVIYSFALIVYIEEDISGYAALKRSADYVKGLWGQVFLKYVVLIILFGLMGAVPFLNIFIGIVATPALTIFGYVIYKHLRAIKA